MKKQLEKKIKNVEEKEGTNATFLMTEKSFERRRIVVVTTKKKYLSKCHSNGYIIGKRTHI